MFVMKKTFEKYIIDTVKQRSDDLIEVGTIQESNEQVLQRVIQLEDRMQVLYDIRERKESDEPWIEVIGGDIDSEKGLQLKLDWNDAFINQLKSQGFKGTSEGALIGQYLLTLSEMVAEGEE